MINTSADQIVFNSEISNFDGIVRRSLSAVADHSLRIYGLEGVSLDEVSAARHIKGAFAKFVHKRILKLPFPLGVDYIKDVWKTYRINGVYSPESFKSVFFSDDGGEFGYKKTHAISVRPCLGLFLLALHCQGVITLPATFTWPKKAAREREEIALPFLSELHLFLRTLDPNPGTVVPPEFEAVASDQKSKEYFISYGTKLLLATGWLAPKDVNVDELLKIKIAEQNISSNHKSRIPLAYRQLLDVLQRKYPRHVTVRKEHYIAALRTDVYQQSSKTNGSESSERRLVADGPDEYSDLLMASVALPQELGSIKTVRATTALPGIQFDLVAHSRAWTDLEELHIRKVRRENYKQIKAALSWFNIYLFRYLPYWFSRNTQAAYAFPSNPSLLSKTLFVSRLLPMNESSPATFIEFFKLLTEQRWSDNSAYGYLKQIEGFFDFIASYADELPDCQGFVQPLTAIDFPATTNARATNKRPVPRRHFDTFLDYHESLYAYSQAVLARVLDEENPLRAKSMPGLQTSILNTLQLADAVGFVPMLFTRTKSICLVHIPNVLDLGVKKVKGHGLITIPRPHGLVQNICALHTGVRHNHLQWLDENFDVRVECASADAEFALLLVNTDKKKTKPWTPTVSMRVIDILREQRAWKGLINEEGFDKEHFYNNNPQTKWAKVKPLFSYMEHGLPHHDNVYYRIWCATLSGFQGLMQELGDARTRIDLVRLMPPGISPNDAGYKKEREEYGARCEFVCDLRVFTESTPHSARAGVVSHYYTFLPSRIIGKYFTGQKAGTVDYYVVIDPRDLEEHQAHQALHLRNLALRQALEPVFVGSNLGTVRADQVHSSLVKNMQRKVGDTIKAHGGMSITFSEVSTTGVDILNAEGCGAAAFNKTEICVYGNMCPPDVVKRNNGWRRCSICHVAARTVDHLPAVIAAKHQVADQVEEIDTILKRDACDLSSKYTEDEIATFEDRLSRLCEDLGGWILCEEVLEATRQRLKSENIHRATSQPMDGDVPGTTEQLLNSEESQWIIQSPEIIERDLQRVTVHTSQTEYLLTRLAESVCFPSLQSPQIRARFDLLRRELMVKAGNVKEAFSSAVPPDPAAECAGMLRSILHSTGATIEQIIKMLESGSHLNLPAFSPKFLEIGDLDNVEVLNGEE